ncbi:MAG: YihY/virulence factor BrkB family protein [Candidatus Binatia bacterium]
MIGRWAALGRELRRPFAFMGALFERLGRHRVPTLAAGLGFYFLLAFFPFILFLVAVVTLVPGVEGLTDWLLATAATYVPAEAWAMVEGVIRGVLSRPRGGLVSLGVGLALWSSSSGFASVMDCLNVAYGVTSRRAWWRARLEALWLTIALSFFMVLAFVLTLFAGPLAALVASYLGPVGGVATIAFNWVISLGLVTLVTATIYYVCPDVDEQPWQWLSPGVVVFTIGFGVASAAFSVWVARFGSYDKTYGSLGAPIVLLFWLYLLALFLLFGGEINALLDERRAAPR